MKLGYECWKRNCKLEDLIKAAISKTIDESRILSLYNLQKQVWPDDGVPQFSEINSVYGTSRALNNEDS